MNFLVFGLVTFCIVTDLGLPQNVECFDRPEINIDALKNFFTNAWQNFKQKAWTAYDPRSYWAEPPPSATNNVSALYTKLKQNPDSFLDFRDMRVAKEDLKPRPMNASDDLKILLYNHGYLKVNESNGSYTLHFHRNSEFALYTDLVNVAREEDELVRNAISKIKSTFQRMPPPVDDFKSFMLALNTVLDRIPHLFAEWELAAIFGVLHSCGLNVTFGHNSFDTRIIHCEHLPNRTGMRMMVDFNDDDAEAAWDDYYRDLILPGLLPASKNLLAVIVTMSDRYDLTNPTIGQWYGVLESADGRILGEYRP